MNQAALADYSDAWGPLGTIVVLLLGWLLQRWTERVKRKNLEAKENKERDERERREREAWEERRVDVAKDVSEAWNPVFAGMGTELKRLGEKCDNCARDLNLVRTDFGQFIDNMESWVAELTSAVPVPADLQRKGRVMFAAARQSHLSHNGSA